MITGADAAAVASDAQQHDLARYLSWIAGPCTDKATKLAHVRSERGDTVAFVGDTVHDIEQARRSRVLSIARLGGYNTTAQLAAASPDFAVEHIDGIIPLLGACR